MKIAILADIHANIYALDAFFLDADKEDIDYFIVAGDLIGYYYWPKEVVARLISDARIKCIRGNHEDILAEARNSTAAADKYRKKYGSGFDVCLETLNEREMHWLFSLPASTKLTLNDTEFSIHHGSPKAEDEYIYPDAKSEILACCHVGRDYTILGHTHYPFLHRLDGSILLNPGSVGQSRDLGGYCSYVVINLENRAMRFKRVPFNVNAVVAAAKAKDPAIDYLHRIMFRGAS
jgi:putative phosphoesterase